MLSGMQKKEAGQVLILIAVAFIGLLGFTALAIDGGMIYSDRRQAQNAADAAALAGSLEKAEGKTDTQAIQKAEQILDDNDYDPSQAAIEVSSTSDIFGSYDEVRVDLSTTTKTYFAHLFGFAEVENQVMAVAKNRKSGPAMPGAAIIAMGDCTDHSGPDHLTSITGGGNSGGILTYGGGIFLNSPDPGDDPCSIDPPTSTGTWGIRAMDGHGIYSVGEYDYPDEDKVSPVPIENEVNHGQRIGDPLSNVQEPVCTDDGSITISGHGSSETATYEPGGYGGPGQPVFGDGTKIWLEPGIYCISGAVHMSGSDELKGDGVTLYIMDDDFSFTGGGDLGLTAPTDDNCLGDDGNRTDSCNYKGLVFFMARGLNKIIDIRGNGMIKVTGTVYALDGDVYGKGGGSDPDDWTVLGQVIARAVFGDGNGSFVVKFDEDVVYHDKPSISLIK